MISCLDCQWCKFRLEHHGVDDGYCCTCQAERDIFTASEEIMVYEGRNFKPQAVQEAHGGQNWLLFEC